ncbi:MAG: AAA family ATPase [Succinivibrionaceae bacterium]|nr:AAA family ATPase [Succinivibrionaceae bacterium]
MNESIPDDLSDFETIRNGNYVYIDKTMFLEHYGKLGFTSTLFLRPRGSGRTLFNQILMYYYDAALKDKGSRLLAQTCIDCRPAPNKNSYAVLRFDFSGIGAMTSMETALRCLRDEIVEGISDFYRRYPDCIPSRFRGKSDAAALEEISDYYTGSESFTAQMALQDFLKRYRLGMGVRPKIMVIVDEYDSIVCDFLSRHDAPFAGLSRITGAIDSMFANIRSYQQSGVIARVFITGTRPIAFGNAISGFVFTEISRQPSLNELAGFTESEVTELIERTANPQETAYSTAELVRIMKERYGGYLFSQVERTTTLNAGRCLRFLADFRANRCRAIPEFTADCGGSDYARLKCCMDLLDQTDRERIICNVVTGKPIAANLRDEIALGEEAFRPTYDQGLLLLYCLGFLTQMSVEEIAQAELEKFDERENTPEKADRSAEHVILCRIPGVQNLNARITDRPGAGSALSHAPCQTDTPQAAASHHLHQSQPSCPASRIVFSSPKTLLMVPNSCCLAMFARYLFQQRNVPWTAFTDAGLNELALKNSPEAILKTLKTVADGFVNTDNRELGESQLALALYAAFVAGTGSVFEVALNRHVTRGSMRGTDIITGGSGKTGIRPKSGRADLVAVNRNQGPSYLFECKYARNEKSNPETIRKKKAELQAQAEKQLKSYARDDRLKTVGDLHLYVVMLAYGEITVYETAGSTPPDASGQP